MSVEHSVGQVGGTGTFASANWRSSSSPEGRRSSWLDRTMRVGDRPSSRVAPGSASVGKSVILPAQLWAMPSICWDAKRAGTGKYADG